MRFGDFEVAPITLGKGMVAWVANVATLGHWEELGLSRGRVAKVLDRVSRGWADLTQQ